MKLYSYVILFSVISLISCREKEKYPTGFFTEEVSNLKDANSFYDDFNMDLPMIMYRHTLHFSSNRNSQGENFDVVGESFYINWLKTNGTLSIGTDMSDDPYHYVKALLDSINTSCNELGPYSVGYQDGASQVHWTDVTLYANDCGGNYDLSFVAGEVSSDQVVSIASSVKLDKVNTEANELYPTFFGEEFYYLDQYGPKPEKIQKMLYCSDKNGSFDIYEIIVPSGIHLIDWLADDSAVEPAKLQLNSAGNDKCPFINGRLMVFASDREGGFGGFDLYYAYYENGAWTAPVNLGEDVNSEHDEYRPVVLHYPEFKNNLLVFSSNRPGGMGGFDLYQTGTSLQVD